MRTLPPAAAPEASGRGPRPHAEPGSCLERRPCHGPWRIQDRPFPRVFWVDSVSAFHTAQKSSHKLLNTTVFVFPSSIVEVVLVVLVWTWTGTKADGRGAFAREDPVGSAPPSDPRLVLDSRARLRSFPRRERARHGSRRTLDLTCTSNLQRNLQYSTGATPPLTFDLHWQITAGSSGSTRLHFPPF